MLSKYLKSFYLLSIIYFSETSFGLIIPDEMTVVEDAIGTYELENLKSIITNSTLNVTELLNSISIRESKQIHSELENKTITLMNSIDNINAKTIDNKSYLTEIFDNLKKNFNNFQTNILKSLSNIKVFVEHQSSQLQNLMRKSGFASQQILASDCLDLYDMRYNASGVYWLQKFGLRVLCDMETDGGGWLLIQRRTKSNTQVNFSQDWNTYKIGFGEMNSEFWIGNAALHMLTNQKRYELLIEMEDYENGTVYAKYSDFKVGNEESNFALDVGSYSGNGSDAFIYHHGRPFTTIDRDNDNYEDGNCAGYFSGGWWYDRCYDAHLNGLFPEPPDRKNSSYISWWARDKENKRIPFVLINVVMKIRPNIN